MQKRASGVNKEDRMWMQKQCLSVCLNRRHTRRFSRILFPGRSFALWLNALRCFKLFRGRLFFFFFTARSWPVINPPHTTETFLWTDLFTHRRWSDWVHDAAIASEWRCRLEVSSRYFCSVSLSARLCSLNDQTHYNDSPPTAPINLFRLPVKPKLALLNEWNMDKQRWHRIWWINLSIWDVGL